MSNKRQFRISEPLDSKFLQSQESIRYSNPSKNTHGSEMIFDLKKKNKLPRCNSNSNDPLIIGLERKAAKK